MFDPSTAALIRSAPQLDELDRDNLPDQLSATYAKIVTTRLRLRSGEDVDTDELEKLIADNRRLAFTNEAFVSASPDRDNRAAAAFVAATAHQLVFNAQRILTPDTPRSFLDASGVSPDISAMLLFLVAESSADAEEMAQWVSPEDDADDRVESALILALRNLSVGRLRAITGSELPSKSAVRRPNPSDAASSALYFTLLKGVRALALQMLRAGEPGTSGSSLEYFLQVKSLSTSDGDLEVIDQPHGPVSVFPGPGHLASILIAVARDMSRGAVVSVPPPSGVDPERWRTYLERLARRRPVLWPNHREAIESGYLEPGASSAIGFPTGAGKSALAELKIATALLAGRSVIFLAPTHALVDQTRNSLARAFPRAKVQHEYLDDGNFAPDEDAPADILIMTPEACLARMSFDTSIFENTGLLVFDECHLLHPSEPVADRRALDAMLCFLNFARLAQEADFVLLSAMMKNTDEIAEWIKDLTGRHCLALSLSWKPTRQLRGSVVYQDEEISDLYVKLQRWRPQTTTKTIPVSIKREVPAKPFALFSLKQTWETRSRDDYTFSPLLEEKPLLGINPLWRLTPNSGEVSSAIAAAAAESGIKSLIFFQTIRNATSATKKVSERFVSTPIRLTDEERKLFRTAKCEFGGSAHLYLAVSENHVQNSAAVHHGLLLPEERRLVESLYQRKDGITVLAATSTVAQGMNLPSELVIIAEDSRYDRELDRREILEAQELLNAAGRAGRAGYNPNGIVLVVPGKVVGFDYDDAKIGAHWSELHQIFGQSDQCLEIDDPLTAVLDRIHANLVEAGTVERYCVSKLAGGGPLDDSSQRLAWAVNRSLAGFRARRRDELAWISSRIRVATELLEHHTSEADDDDTASRDIAAALGLSVDLVENLTNRLTSAPPSAHASVFDWRRWFFGWLADNPDFLEQVIRRDDLDSLFGSAFKKMETEHERADYAIPRLRELTRLWMKGRPLRKLEIALGIDRKKLKTCDGARKFVIRIIPSLAHASSLPALLKQYPESTDESDAGPIEPQLSQFAFCVRHGFDHHEKAALYLELRERRLSRVRVHKRFKAIRPHLASAATDETWEDTLGRVKAALEAI
ncbi:MAG: DEAD/DEAH box helicase [Chloroflexi bacterium]|nr:DEAD/DEAH box helicase [Chloroflexota bacterium]